MRLVYNQYGASGTKHLCEQWVGSPEDANAACPPPVLPADAACCPTAETHCSGPRVDLDSDAQNCGSCGNACNANEACSAGTCCPTGQMSCGGSCVDTTVDSNNCGSCGNVCAFNQTCGAGLCQGSGGTCPTASGWYRSIIRNTATAVNWSASVGAPFSNIFDDGTIRASGSVEMTQSGGNCILHLSASVADETSSTVSTNGSSYTIAGATVVVTDTMAWNLIDSMCSASAPTCYGPMDNCSQQSESGSITNPCSAAIAAGGDFEAGNQYLVGKQPWAVASQEADGSVFGDTVDINFSMGAAQNDIVVSVPVGP